MKLDSQVSRAALLRALQTCAGDKVGFAETADLFGYQASADYWLRVIQSDQSVEEISEAAPDNDGNTELTTATVLRPPKPRPQVTYYYLSRHERYASEESATKEQPELFENIEPLRDEDLTGFWDEQAPLTPDGLTRPATMAPVVRAGLRQEVGRRLDVKTLVKQIAQQTPLRQLPTEPRLLPAGRVTVIADLNQRLLPFWEDIREACELIRQKHGRIGLDIRVLAKDEPLADYYEFDDWLKRQLVAKTWEKIPAQSVVFILSDLGQLAAGDSLIRKRWLYFVTQLNRRGIKPWVLAPIAAEKQCPMIQASTHLLLWQRFGRLKKQRSRGDKRRHEVHVERLLSFLSLSPHIEPALLRSLCELLAHDEGSSGVEADVYLHPAVNWGYTSITLKTSQREYYQQQFEQLDETLKQQVLALIERHHSSQFPSVWAEAILNAEPLMEVDKALVGRAEKLMLSFALRYHSEPAHEGMMRFARRHIRRLKPEQRQAKEYVSGMYAQAYRNEIATGQALPEWCDSRIANQVLREVGEPRWYNILQLGHSIVIELSDPQPGRIVRGQVLTHFSSRQATAFVNQQEVHLPSSSEDQFYYCPVIKTGETLRIDTGQQRFDIQCAKKPSWASAIRMDKGHLIATLCFNGQDYLLERSLAESAEVLPDWVVLNGEDTVGFDNYGLYAEITINDITQRLRYIEPNTFMMGSPEGENGRYDQYESHRQVTLTQGYWLADTACTQELWQALMDKNPAEFKDSPQNPVENVSWLDVQEFLAKLNEHHPALGAHLPTEAQWENACRAGTDTPFNFEGELSLEKVNYRGTWELEKEGDSYKWGQSAKQKTVPVSVNQANAWGLYEMHGNVWEWCFDEWQENLGQETMVDPVTARFKSGVKPDRAATVTGNTGSTPDNTPRYVSTLLENGGDGGVTRLLRGGSWNDGGGGCRSAIRNGNGASDRNWNDGLRFAVGHELQNSTAQYNEQTEQNTARRGAGQGFDQAGSGRDKPPSRDISAYIEAQKIQSSLRSDEGFSVDDMDEPLIDRLAKGVRGLFGRKKDKR